MTESGEVLDQQTVRFERLLPGPIERVWSYLVDADQRAKWLCSGETELKTGGHVDLIFENAKLSGQQDIERPEKYQDMPERVSFTGTVTRCEPPYVLAHTWDYEDTASEVCYTLAEVGERVRLVITHSKLTGRDEMQSVCGGWHTHMDILVDVLNGEEPQPFWKVHSALEADYEERLKQVT